MPATKANTYLASISYRTPHTRVCREPSAEVLPRSIAERLDYPFYLNQSTALTVLKFPQMPQEACSHRQSSTPVFAEPFQCEGFFDACQSWRLQWIAAQADHDSRIVRSYFWDRPAPHTSESRWMLVSRRVIVILFHGVPQVVCFLAISAVGTRFYSPATYVIRATLSILVLLPLCFVVNHFSTKNILWLMLPAILWNSIYFAFTYSLIFRPEFPTPTDRYNVDPYLQKWHCWLVNSPSTSPHLSFSLVSSPLLSSRLLSSPLFSSLLLSSPLLSSFLLIFPLVSSRLLSSSLVSSPAAHLLVLYCLLTPLSFTRTTSS